MAPASSDRIEDRDITVDYGGRRSVPDNAVGGMLLAALRADRRYGAWSLAGIEPDLLPGLAVAAERHQVLPLVRRALIDSGRLDRSKMPIGLAGHLDSAAAGAVLQHLRVTAELERIAPLLDTIGEPWVVVKGPVLAELAYPFPELRSYADLDVLVHPRAFGEAVAALESRGAQLVDKNWSFMHRHGRAETTMLLPLGTSLDLHWNLVNNAQARSEFAWDTDASLARRRLVGVGSVLVPTLDVEDTLLHVALHGAFSGGYRLSWVKDVDALVTLGDCDWGELARRARAARVTLPVGAMLRRARRLLGADVPRSVMSELDTPRSAALALEIGEHLATSSALARGRRTAQLLMLSARADLRTSAAALGAELAAKLEHAWRGPRAGDDLGGISSRQLDDDPDGRRRYLDEVADLGCLRPLGAPFTRQGRP